MWGRGRDRGESEFRMEPCEREKRLAECTSSGVLPNKYTYHVSKNDTDRKMRMRHVHVLPKPISQLDQFLPPHSPSHRTTVLRFYHVLGPALDFELYDFVHERDRERSPGRSSVSNSTNSAFHRFPATDSHSHPDLKKNKLPFDSVLVWVLAKADRKERPNVLSLLETANWKQSLPAVS